MKGALSRSLFSLVALPALILAEQGSRIRARTGTQELHGIFEGLDPSGALLLAGDDGKRHVITAGEVFPAG